MRKLFTFLLTMVVAMVANAAIPPTILLGDEFTSVAALDGKTFAIVDKAAEKALFGSNNQNLAFDAYGSAFVTTNSGYTWQLESLAENEDESVHGYYLLHLVAPNGTPVPTSDWGGKYLNSQDKGGWCCFNLGITAKKLGQDIDYGAVWDVQFVEGKGFSLKNIGTGLYKGADGGTANKEEAAYFAFAPVSITYVPALKALLAEGEAMKKRGASSAAYDAAIEGIDPDKSEDALADAQKVEAALPALAKTQLTAGSDFTRAIANFDCGAKDGWTFEKPKGGNGPDHGGDFEYWAGNASNRAEASFDYWQEITGLPNGTYTVSAEMYNSLNNEGGNYTEFKPTVGVYATVGEKTVSKLVDVNSETRVPYVTDVIEVTDGKIRIGVKSFEAPMAARWFTVDNFKLTLVKPAVAPTAPEKDAWYTGADFFRFRADKNVTAESPYYAWKDKVEPVWGADADDVSNGCIVCNVPANVNPQSQIWIRGTEAGKTVANGSKDGFKITFRVKADGEYTLESQAHNNWGYKTGGNPFGPLNVTTEWQTVTFVCTGEKAKNDFTDLCFNLSGDAERTIYFDDVQIVRGSEWYLNNEFHAKDYQDPTATYSDGQDPHPAARFVSDAEGGYVEVISNANAGQTYNSQLWIAIPEQFVGTISKMTMEVQATKEITCPESFQATATGNGWGCNPGPGKGVEFKVGEWTTIERILKTNGVQSTGTWKNLQADQYCLDLSDVSDAKEAVTYKFRNVKFEEAQEDWYTATPIFAKDYTKGDETYTDGVQFPAAPYKYGSGDEGGYIEVVSNADAANDYGSQIFFEIPEELLGKSVQVSMKVKASKAIEVATALHGTADGNGWSPAAAGDKVAFTVGEWTDIARTFNSDAKDKNGDQVKYYVLNLSDNVGKEAIKYDFDEVSFQEFIDWGELEEAPVEGTLVATQDWTTATSYSGWNILNDATKVTLSKGEGLVIENSAELETPYSSQFFVADGWTFDAGKQYVVRYTAKIKGEGSIRTDVNHWGDGVADEGVPYTDGYKQILFTYGVSPVSTGGWHVIFQPGKFIGKIILEKVELFDVTPKYDEMDWSENILKNGDLSTDDMSEFILKNNDVENPEMLLAEKNQYGEIGIETAALPAEGGNDYDAQFFVRLPYVLPKGTLFNLEFDLYAEHVNTLAIAAHGEPGEWKANISSVKTDPSLDAVHYQEYLTAPADMRSIAFNLAVADATTYGFSNIKVQIVNDEKAAIEEATQTADATTLWAETLALNEACYAGRITETEGYTEESVKALTDAIAAGKAALAPADGDPAPTKESLTAAAKAITDAIAGLKKDAPALAYTDLTKEMFFHWNAADETAEALEASNCDYNIGTSTGQPYGLSTVNHDRFADLSAYNTIELTATEGEPRLLFNRIENEGTVFAEVPRDKDKYETVVDNGDGSKTYVIDIAAIVAEYGFAHLHAIKGANWVNTTVTEIKLGYAGEKPALPIPTAIEGVETAEDALQDGKYFINGQIVIVKNGVKYNAAGVAIK